jgi:outer membrane receptor for ferrienterochelin and colicins
MFTSGGSQRPGISRLDRQRRLWLVGVCLAGLVAVPAQAQQTSGQDATEEEKLAVAEANTAASSSQLEAIVVTASSVATDLRNAPASVSVIDRATLDNQAIATLSEAIRTVPGVNVGFNSNGTRGISIRGLGSSYTLILIDGKRVNSGLTTLRNYNGDLDWVPMAAIERVEIVRGPMSTLYGSDALGGVVNIITKKNSAIWTGTLTTEWLQPESKATGSTRRVSGYLSGPVIRDVLTFAAFGNYSKKLADDPTASGDIETPRGTEDFDFNGRFTWTPTATQTIEFEAGHGRERYNPYVAPGEEPTSPTTVTRTTASVRHVGVWDFGTSTVTGYMEDAKNQHEVVDRAGEVLGDGITVRNYTLDGKVDIPLDWVWKQNLTLGGEVRYEELNDPENLGKANTVTGTTGLPFTDAWTAAVFAEDQIDFTDDFRMTAGLRYDYHDHFGSHFSPRTYFIYDLTDSISLKTGWAQAFKAPNLRQLDPNWVQTSRGRGCGAVGGPCEMVGNPDLKPETSNSYEAGFYYEQGGWTGSLSYFYNEIDNKITSARVASLITGDGTKYVQQINVDKALSQGIEGGLTIPVHPDVQWTNSFTYLIESKNVETGMPLSSDPQISLHSSVTWQANEQLSFTFAGNYYGKQVDYVLQPETLTAQNVEPYFVADIGAKYDFNDNFSGKLGVNNIFDQQPESESNFKENGRTYFFSLTSSF